jgi:hypothetical protein
VEPDVAHRLHVGRVQVLGFAAFDARTAYQYGRIARQQPVAQSRSRGPADSRRVSVPADVCHRLEGLVAHDLVTDAGAAATIAGTPTRIFAGVAGSAAAGAANGAAGTEWR